jgi:tRNA (adenine57-N1/adenine58-N1)-methyltransferase
MSSALLVDGDLVLLVDSKKRQYLITLEVGGEFHSHAGVLPHDQIIGKPEGSTAATTRGQKYRFFKPTLSDFITTMPRGAQVIYPKDLAAILMMADIGPGQNVFETGVGSGALSMTLLRAGVNIIGYEIREDFANKAKKNVESFLGAEALERYDVRLMDSYESIPEGPFDRVILDVPEPWQVLPHVPGSLRRGGIVVAYTPSVTQVQKVRAVFEHGPYAEVHTQEVLHRGWYVEGQAVRPDHRMVAHTAFLTRARLMVPED